MDKIENMYTVIEAAKLLHISPNALRIRIRKGQIPAYKPNPVKQGYVYICESDLLAYLEKSKLKAKK